MTLDEAINAMEWLYKQSQTAEHMEIINALNQAKTILADLPTRAVYAPYYAPGYPLWSQTINQSTPWPEIICTAAAIGNR